MKKINQKIITSIFIFFIIFLLSISIILANGIGNKENTKINEEKIYYQIRYLDNEIIHMCNLINNNQFEDNLEELLNKTNNLYNSWNSIILDLNNLSIEKKNLTDFGKTLDNLVVSIKYKNKNIILNNLMELYSKLIIYIDNLNYKDYQNVLSCKYNLMVAKSIVGTGNWTLTHEYILNASDSIYKVFNKIQINEYEQYNINQAYVSVKEMENLINIKDVDVFDIKYNIAIKKLENI